MNRDCGVRVRVTVGLALGLVRVVGIVRKRWLGYLG